MAPTSLAPTTLSPTTLSPTTLSPTTLSPTTLNPTTLHPTTLSPTTLNPTTQSPTTLNPTTLTPTTQSPTTQSPTTQSPTTQSPTVTTSILVGQEIAYTGPLTPVSSPTRTIHSWYFNTNTHRANTPQNIEASNADMVSFIPVDASDGRYLVVMFDDNPAASGSTGGGAADFSVQSISGGNLPGVAVEDGTFNGYPNAVSTSWVNGYTDGCAIGPFIATETIVCFYFTKLNNIVNARIVHGTNAGIKAIFASKDQMINDSTCIVVPGP